MSYKFNPFTGTFDLTSEFTRSSLFDLDTTSGTANLTLYKTYIVNTSGGAATLTLPAPTSGGYVTVKDNGSAETNNITVNDNTTELIDGAATYVITSNYGSATFVSNGTTWYIL